MLQHRKTLETLHEVKKAYQKSMHCIIPFILLFYYINIVSFHSMEI